MEATAAIYAPSLHHERILPRHGPRRHDRLAPWRETPAAGPERPVQDAAVLDLGQIDDAVGFHFDVVGVDGCEEDVGGFFGEGYGGKAVEGARPVYLALIFVEEDGLVEETLCEVREGRGRLFWWGALGFVSWREWGCCWGEKVERTEVVGTGLEV